MDNADPTGHYCVDVSIFIVDFGECNDNGYFGIGTGVGFSVSYSGNGVANDEEPPTGTQASCSVIPIVGEVWNSQSGGEYAFGVGLGCGIYDYG
jgi:hypothetical protein